MSKEYGDVPAFPFVSHGGRSEHQDCYSGMSLRDYFAAKAMQAWLSQIPPEEMEDMMRRWSENSYEMADAMLKARND
ncbi:hypothetical protein JHU04_002468 [Brenneria sp. 4F2]|nr:hypothetical protein [Brenneria bubanii]